MKSVINILPTKKINVIKAVTALLNSNITTTTAVFLGNVDYHAYHCLNLAMI